MMSARSNYPLRPTPRVDRLMVRSPRRTPTLIGMLVEATQRRVCGRDPCRSIIQAPLGACRDAEDARSLHAGGATWRRRHGRRVPGPTIRGSSATWPSKCCLPAAWLNADARKRLRKEALAISRLNHPNIAVVHDFASDEDVDFIVMELVPGTTLDEKLARGPMSESDIIAINLIQDAQGARHRPRSRGSSIATSSPATSASPRRGA